MRFRENFDEESLAEDFVAVIKSENLLDMCTAHFVAHFVIVA